MSKKKSKILEDTINYLKFYKEYNNYEIYGGDVKENKQPFVSDSGKKISKPSEENIIKQKIETAEIFPETVKEVAKKTEIKSIIKDNGKWKDSETLDKFYKEIENCKKCAELSETRAQIVFGYGNPDADIVVVGEAPGAEEDKQGKPFVGRAGKLLTDILKAINFDREEIYICNILKCRPPENRNPHPDEIENCEPYLFKQLELIKPKMILAVGTFAGQTLLKSKETLGQMRGKFHIYNGIKMMVTYHPAALLRNPNWKKPTWEDVQLFRKEYDSMVK